MAKRQPKTLTVEKAKEILRDGTVHGKPLSPSQRRLFEARAGGAELKTKLKTRKMKL